MFKYSRAALSKTQSFYFSLFKVVAAETDRECGETGQRSRHSRVKLETAKVSLAQFTPSTHPAGLTGT